MSHDITITIPHEKIQKVIDALKTLYPIPEDEDSNPIFTDQDWVKESIRRFVVKTVARWEQQQAVKEISFTLDEDIAS